MTSLIPWKKGRANAALAHRAPPAVSPFGTDLDALYNCALAGWPNPFGPDRFAGWGLNVKETDRHVQVQVDAPGFEPGEFDVQVSGNTLRVTAEHKATGDEGSEERRVERYVELPAAVDAEKVEATYRNGVLNLSLPKAEHARWRSVAVKAG